ncbi:MAG: hypothetical protein RXQ77_04025 [Candidatus Nanopusillus sp.]
MVSKEFNIEGPISEIFEIDLNFLRDEIKFILNEIDRTTYGIKTGYYKPEAILDNLDGIYIETLRMNTLHTLILNKAIAYRPNNIELRNFLEDYNTSYITPAIAWIDAAKDLYKKDPNQYISNVYKLLTKLKNLLKEADLKLIEAINRRLFI